jgi:hypothetical protein
MRVAAMVLKPLAAELDRRRECVQFVELSLLH